MALAFPELDEYADLDHPGWDSYGAKPISGRTIDRARHLASTIAGAAAAEGVLFRSPVFCPCGDGGISLSWERLRLTVLPGGGVECFLRDDPRRARRWHDSEAMAVTLALRVLRWLAEC